MFFWGAVAARLRGAPPGAPIDAAVIAMSAFRLKARTQAGCASSSKISFRARPREYWRLRARGYLMKVNFLGEKHRCAGFHLSRDRRRGCRRCREPSWLENIELRVKKAIKRPVPQFLLRQTSCGGQNSVENAQNSLCHSAAFSRSCFSMRLFAEFRSVFRKLGSKRGFLLQQRVRKNQLNGYSQASDFH
jgi:hypothetical protein